MKASEHLERKVVKGENQEQQRKIYIKGSRRWAIIQIKGCH